ncbi:MAG: tetratricopeptide repeat protein [Pirellulales bacterium]|nr:tetratricopeptide repeat protein [Pirellulales bacterium]
MASSADPTMPRRPWADLLTAAALAALLAAAVTAVFGRVADYGFLAWDDTTHVTENPYLNPAPWESVKHFWQKPYWGLYAPLSYTFFAAEASVFPRPLPDGGWGPNPMVFHLGSLSLHIGCVLLVFVILRRLFRHDGAACLGALLFGLHPVQVESVAWISETRGLLCGLFSLLALWQYLGYADTSQPGSSAAVRYALATVCFVLALLCKPAAVALPLLVAVLDFGVLQRSVRRVLSAVGPWLLVAAAWVLITKMQQPDRQLPFVSPLWARPLLAGDALAFYATKLVVPWPLGPDYGRSPEWVMRQGGFYVAWLLPAILLAILGWLKHRRIWLTAAGVSIAWVLPVLGLVPFVFQRVSTVADRYLYLVLLGPALALSWLLARHWNRRTVVPTSCLLGLLAILSFVQTGYWRDNDALLNQAMQVNPHSGVMRQLRGFLLTRQREYGRAIALLRETVEDHPQLVEAHLGLAAALTADGQAEEAIDALKKAARRFPREPLVESELGVILAGQGALDEAEGHYRRALQIDPHCVRAHLTWGKLLLDRGQPAAAVEHFRKALDVVPNHVAARVNLAVALQALNRPDEARYHYLRAIQLRPHWPVAHYNLANLLRLQGAADEAVRHYRAALKADPDYVAARINLGTTLLEQGTTAEARDHLRRALAQVPPDSPEARQIRDLLPQQDQWRSLFDGKQLGAWQVVEYFDFIHHGQVEVKEGTLVLGRGKPGTAVRYTGEVPEIDYEISLQAMRVDGEDFFCGMTFPVGRSALTLIVGGWRGPVVGLSCIDGEPAVDNETCFYQDFQKLRWYAIRLRVQRERIQVWIDEERVVDLPTHDREFTIWFEPETALPLSIATWDTTGALRDIRVRPCREHLDPSQSPD